MDELVRAIDRIAEIEKAKSPEYVSIIMAVVPILLTIITIIMSWRMDRQNRKLQEMIHNRDILNQYRQDLLSIYNTYLEAWINLLRNGSVENIFSHEQLTYDWNHNINNMFIEVSKACDKAKLLLDDKELIDSLISVRDEYKEICTCVSRYIYNNTCRQVLVKALETVALHNKITVNDIINQAQNPVIHEQLLKHCENENTREISKKIENLSTKMSSDEFDSMFRKYLQFHEIAFTSLSKSVKERENKGSKRES